MDLGASSARRTPSEDESEGVERGATSAFGDDDSDVEGNDSEVEGSDSEAEFEGVAERPAKMVLMMVVI